MEARSLVLAALFFATQLLAFDTKSSISPSQGDKNTAPITEESDSEIPGDRVLPPKAENHIDEIIRKAREALEVEQKKITNETDFAALEEKKDIQNIAPQKVPKKRFVRKVIHDEPKVIEPFTYLGLSGETISVFSSNLRTKKEETITVPSGSHAFGRAKFGEEVTAKGEREIVAQLDYAFLGPNESIVEMTGCVVWFTVNSDFHSQKVRGQAKDLTCVSPSGRVFTVAVEGVLVGAAKEYGGTESSLIMRGPAKAAALKFLGDITSAYGNALSTMETTTRAIRAGEDRDSTVSNVTGDKSKFVGGKVLEANGEFLKYISSFFQAMEPTLALAPGTKIHFVNRYNVEIPKEFFKTTKGAKK